ncbi:hypothetical protein PTTG_07500 [Puccinia triticina 1-1 BBBD Race 1]|uniref:WD_REPEATS_REGION domain-containing protein n=2 Tax=Puccinia triticina TaxID=208348 RepID=A0A180GVQ1_PUCT1|nr:uncharacterized protein PtA15_6A360 [Puccinia triticina]OAV96896.1 hypothetical protein PTTG_07500 [Puccinia triticina 1-1 BBBD Race 1]WAQ85731.1 hypothetical protein PtA15_6A360 [Puccinia triticina]WAR55606.1 hypothetical protein PtB15_6B349 [Puccinia triticina]
MAQTHFLALPNKDLISSFSFNYYGTRLAVSSLDHHLYILSSDLESGKWPEDQSQEQQPGQSAADPAAQNGSHPSQRKTPSIQAWTAHEGPVIKVVWSDPIHGEILASAGTDGTVRIWEEDTRRLDQSNGNENQTGAKANTTKQNAGLSPGGWYQQTILADSNRTIRDIGFSPSETSLRLASISTDNHLRVYECLETNSFSSDNWNLVINIDLSVLPSHPTTSFEHLNPTLATIPGSSSGTGGPQQHSSFTSVRGFDPTVSLNNPNKNNPSTNFNLINPLSGLRSSATASHTSPFNQAASINTPSSSDQHLECFGGWALSWCPESYWGDILAASAGASGAIRLFRFSGHSQWENFGFLSPLSHSKSATGQDFTLPSHRHHHHSSNTNNSNTGTSSSGQRQTGGTTTAAGAGPATPVSPISSLAWAPPCGRDYHLIAAGHRDGRARIWKLIPALPPSSQWSFALDTELEDHIHTPKQPLDSLSTHHQLLKNPVPPLSADAGVGKCEWNVTGTVLSTSGSDGKVRIWKMGYTSRWVNTAEINCIDEHNQETEDAPPNNHSTSGIITVG